MKRKPTDEFYQLWQYVYDYFNRELFDNRLPNCLMVTTNRQSVAGHYSYKRWKSLDEGIAHELALNPNYFMSHPRLEILQTMVHEMVHCWQYEFGTPGKNGYHNKEWADKMCSFGLIPTDTGKEGGKMTGYKISDYAQEGGLFEEKATVLLDQNVFKSLWYTGSTRTSFLSEEELMVMLASATDEGVEEVKDKKKKIKYSCQCGNNVWGKGGLIIKYEVCQTQFSEQ